MFQWRSLAPQLDHRGDLDVAVLQDIPQAIDPRRVGMDHTIPKTSSETWNNSHELIPWIIFV